MKFNTAYSFAGNQAYWPLHQSRSYRASGQSLNLKGQLSRLFQTLSAQLTGASEPRVWQSQGADGQTLWNAYDGAYNKLIRNASETELRVWLETRYRA